MKRRVFLFPAAVFLGTACLLSGCDKKSATGNAGEVYVYNYNVICPSDYMIQKMIENDLLAELNFDNIPNISEIDPEFMERSKAFDPENKYSVPYTWGTVGILYNTSMAAPEEGTNVWIDSWVIPKNAKNKENAEKWIDFLCRPDIAMQLSIPLIHVFPRSAHRMRKLLE